MDSLKALRKRNNFVSCLEYLFIIVFRGSKESAKRIDYSVSILEVIIDKRDLGFIHVKDL
jgi:hypothetical protein